jgi:flagellar motor switch protein FliN/FliY
MPLDRPAASPVILAEPVTTPSGEPLLPPNLELVKNVRVKLEARLGGAEMPIAELFSLRDGSVVELDRRVDESIDLVLDGRVVARGELVAVGDQLGVRIVEVAAN